MNVCGGGRVEGGGREREKDRGGMRESVKVGEREIEKSKAKDFLA